MDRLDRTAAEGAAAAWMRRPLSDCPAPMSAGPWRAPLCERPRREHVWRADDEWEDSLHLVCPSSGAATETEGERET